MKQKKIHPLLTNFLEGEVVLIDKPLRWTSFDAVKKVRIATGVSKVGHAGTLDPLATGLLIICTGAFTKRINDFMKLEKEYTGTFTVGAVTPTLDLESEPENFKHYDFLTSGKITETTQQFTGDILQTPPQFSAIKKDGKPLYLSARKGIDVKVEPRQINISSFEITGIQLPEVSFKIVCSTGTYIRTIANDFGQALGTGAYLSSLRRTRIGDFNVDDAITPETFAEKIQQRISSAESLERQADT